MSSPKIDQAVYGNHADPHIWKSFPFFCLATAVSSKCRGCYIWQRLQKISLERISHCFQFLLSFALPLEILRYVPGNRRQSQSDAITRGEMQVLRTFLGTQVTPCAVHVPELHSPFDTAQCHTWLRKYSLRKYSKQNCYCCVKAGG